MKEIFYIIVLFTLFASCDKIDSPYSIPVNPTDTSDNNGDVKIRKVLLEDYTGHKCQGCPAAHTTANNLKAYFQDSVVLLTVHAGFWTSVNASGSFTYDFKTPAGTELYSTLIPSTQPFPTGTVNRKKFNNLYVVDYPDWGSRISDLLTIPADAALTISPSWNDAGRTISAEVKTKFLNSLAGDYALAIYYSEDSIINWQAFPSPIGNVSNYVHRHVLRGTLSGTWGAVVSSNPASGDSIVTTATGPAIAPEIRPEQVHVIAVLFDAVSKEVIQAEEKKLLP